MDQTGYRRHIEESAETSERAEDRLDNVQEFRGAAREFTHLGVEEGLTAFLEGISLVSDVDSFEEQPDAITLITLHQSKGLEFPVVFMVGMEEGLLPHSRSMDTPEEIEEERRLCYVGVTRAQKRLYLLRAFRRGFWGGSGPSDPSRFLEDIPRDLIEGAAQFDKPIRQAQGRLRRLRPSPACGPRGRRGSVRRPTARARRGRRWSERAGGGGSGARPRPRRRQRTPRGTRCGIRRSATAS